MVNAPFVGRRPIDWHADPSRVVIRPPSRDGSVNGALLRGRTLGLRYAVADSFTTFATMLIDRLLAAMV